MRGMNAMDLRKEIAAQELERKQLSAKVRKLEAENKRLRKALEPMTRGTFWLNMVDVTRAKKALGMLPSNALGQEPCADVCARSPAPLG